MACAVSGVKLYDAYIMGDTMGISRVELLKDLLPNMNRLFEAEYENLKIDQIIHNEAVKQKELEDAIQEQSR
jgi:hypothetical protein